jgi:hypothetical protein
MDQRTSDSSCRKGLVWYADGSRTAERTGAGVYGQSLEKYATVVQAEIYAMLGPS